MKEKKEKEEEVKTTTKKKTKKKDAKVEKRTKTKIQKEIKEKEWLLSKSDISNFPVLGVKPFQIFGPWMLFKKMRKGK